MNGKDTHKNEMVGCRPDHGRCYLEKFKAIFITRNI